MEKRKITINEIAEKAGVSIATVSRIINGKNNVKPETEKYVLDIIAQLEKEYGLDTKLSANRNNPIILLVTEFDSPVLNDFAAGVQKTAVNNGYHVITMDYSKHRIDFFSEVNFLVKNIPIAGIIMLNNYEDLGDVESLAARFPIVTAFTSNNSKKISSIGIDNVMAGKTVAEYILSLGIQKPVLLAINNTFDFSRIRESSILDTFKQAGIIIPKSDIIHLPGFDCGVAASMIRQRLSTGYTPEAIICINDALAAIAIREVKHAGYSIPEDIIVTGFDNTEIATLIDPNITTINQQAYQIGSQAANILLGQLEHPDLPVQHIILNGEFIVRESTQKIR